MCPIEYLIDDPPDPNEENEGLVVTGEQIEDTRNKELVAELLIM